MSETVIIRPEAFQSPDRQIRLILASLPIFAGLLSKDGEVLECNFGPLGPPIQARSDWVGQPFEDGPWWNYSEESRADIVRIFEMAKKGEPVSSERLYRHPNGNMGVMLLKLTPLFSPRGETDTILTTALDVTERRREGESAETISHDLSHRLRNSFTIMRALATRSDDADGSGRALSKRVSQIRRSHELAHEYLFFDVPVQNIILAAVGNPNHVSYRSDETISISNRHVELLMLAIGELSAFHRKATVIANRQKNGKLRLTWKEDELRPHHQLPSGFMKTLLTDALERQTRGKVVMQNRKTGFVWRLEFPIDANEKPTKNSAKTG